MYQLSRTILGCYLCCLEYNIMSLDVLSLRTTALYSSEPFFGDDVAISRDVAVITSEYSVYSHRLDDSNSHMKLIDECYSPNYFKTVDISYKNNYLGTLKRNSPNLDTYLYLYDYDASNDEWINSTVNNLSEIYMYGDTTEPQLAITDEYVVAIANLYIIFTRNDNNDNGGGSDIGNGWSIDTVLTCNKSALNPDIYEWSNFHYNTLCIDKTFPNLDIDEDWYGETSGLPLIYSIGAKGDYIVTGHDGANVVVLKRDKYKKTWSLADTFEIHPVQQFIESIDIIGSEANYIVCGTYSHIFYIFEKMADEDRWIYVTNITSSNKHYMALSIEGDTMLMGVPGLVYVFKNRGIDMGINANWTQMAKITVQDVVKAAGDSVQSQNISNAAIGFGWIKKFVNDTAIIGGIYSGEHVFIIFHINDIDDEKIITSTKTPMKDDTDDAYTYRYVWNMGTMVYLSLLFATYTSFF